MSAVFMSHPTTVLRQWLMQETPLGVVERDFNLGRLAMALEVLTQIKILHDLPLTELSAHVEGALQALLIDQGLMDDAEKVYEKLDAWRAPKFVADHGGDKPTGRVSGSASSVVAPEGALARTRRLREALPAHRDPDDFATSASEESPGEEDPSTRSE